MMKTDETVAGIYGQLYNNMSELFNKAQLIANKQTRKLKSHPQSPVNTYSAPKVSVAVDCNFAQNQV